MKKLSETLTEMGIGFAFPIEIKDSNGNQTYFEASSGYCYRYERDAKGRVTYYETSDYWYRYEYDADGNVTYSEDSDGKKEGSPKSAKTCEGKVVEVDGIKYELKAL